MRTLHSFTQSQAYLGAQVPDVAGVVLHSPLLSGIRVLSPGLRWWPSFADVYPNHLMVPKIESPTLILHVRRLGGSVCVRGAVRRPPRPEIHVAASPSPWQGTEDEVIHVSCGQRLHELCKNPVEPLWAEGFNHQVWEQWQGGGEHRFWEFGLAILLVIPSPAHLPPHLPPTSPPPSSHLPPTFLSSVCRTWRCAPSTCPCSRALLPRPPLLWTPPPLGKRSRRMVPHPQRTSAV